MLFTLSALVLYAPIICFMGNIRPQKLSVRQKSTKQKPYSH